MARAWSSGRGPLVHRPGRPAHSDALNLAMGANGIDLNNDADFDVTVAGIEHYKMESDRGWQGRHQRRWYHDDRCGVHTGPRRSRVGRLRDPGQQSCWSRDRVGTASAVTSTTPPLARSHRCRHCHDKTLTGGAGTDRISATGDGYNTVAPGAGDDFMRGAGDSCGGNNLDYSASPNAINANFPGDTVNGWGLDTWIPRSASRTSSARRRATSCSAGRRVQLLHPRCR